MKAPLTKRYKEVRRGSDWSQRVEFCMASSFGKRHLSYKARQALELLAVDERGLTETLLRTYGFTLGMLDSLVRTGLATAQRQTVKAGGKTMEVVRIRITEAGRDALAAERLNRIDAVGDSGETFQPNRGKD